MIAAPLVADHLKDALGQVRRQRRGHLVEHQDVGFNRERPGQVDDPERGERQAPRQARQIELSQTQLAEPVAERLEGRLREAQVRADVQVRDQRRLLVDGNEAAAACLGRRVDDALPAAHHDGPMVGMDRARQNLDQGALPGTVGTHECMDLTRAHDERR